MPGMDTEKSISTAQHIEPKEIPKAKDGSPIKE
jgi:hypothetical protein